MKKHAIIPIFIPHRGCGHECVFCNQRLITARQPDVTPEDVQSILDTWLSTMQRLETIEAAFYGGSFTGLPMEEQAAFLAVTKEYKDSGRIDKIHLSTRPDYIDAAILDQLRAFDVDIIELGVQSFDPEVLELSRRGHSVDDIYRACELIKSYGFELGIQLMIGLPGDSYEKCMDSVRQTVGIGPSLARLYPTVVLADTELQRMYEAGLYHPLTSEEAVAITKDMYRVLDDAGITILRVGLKSTDLISDSDDSNASEEACGRGDDHDCRGSNVCSGRGGSAVLAHSFHPAFRQLVEGEIAREDLEAQLQELLRGETTNAACGETLDAACEETSSSETKKDACSRQNDRRSHTHVIFAACGESFSNMIGHKACNKQYFSGKYPNLSIRFTVDNSLPRGSYQVKL